MYVACEGLSDLGHGRNQPTATIIGQYIASYHDGAPILILVVVQIDPSLAFDQNLAHLFDHTSLMSGMFAVCMLLVKGCQTLVMAPTSLLQQSLVNTAPHTIMVHCYLLWLLRKFQFLIEI